MELKAPPSFRVLCSGNELAWLEVGLNGHNEEGKTLHNVAKQSYLRSSKYFCVMETGTLCERVKDSEVLPNLQMRQITTNEGILASNCAEFTTYRV